MASAPYDVPHRPATGAARSKTESACNLPGDIPGRLRAARPRTPLYTPAQRARRDASRWTIVQAVLAPLQFLVFIVSLCLVLRYLFTGQGLMLATVSVVAKTLVLYLIMITGSIWEKEVFGRYLFARSFFYEDLVSILVLLLHTAYLLTLFLIDVEPASQMLIALVAYAAYVVNAGQYLLKLRAARLGARPSRPDLDPRRSHALGKQATVHVAGAEELSPGGLS